MFRSLGVLIAFLGCSATQSAALAQSSLANRIAPEECFAFSSWSGFRTEFKETANNHTKQLLSEPEVQEFCTELKKRLSSLPLLAMRDEPAVKQELVRGLMPRLIDMLLAKPGAFVLEDIELQGGQVDVSASLLFQFGSGASDLVGTLVTLANMEGAGLEARTEGELDVYTIPVPDSPLSAPLRLAAINDYIVITLGDDTLTQLSKKLGSKNAILPALPSSANENWLAKLRYEFSGENRDIGYVNLAAFYELLLKAAGDDSEQISTMATALGLHNLDSIMMSAGFDDVGVVQQMRLSWKGQATGLLKLVGQTPLNRESLDMLPADTLFASSMSVDLADVMDRVLAILDMVSPYEAENFRDGMSEFEHETGFALKEQLLENLGSTWTIFNGAGDGLGTGIILTVDLKQADALEDSILELSGVLRGLSRRGNGPKLDRRRVAGANVYTFTFPGEPMPVQPSFCVSGNHLFVSLYPHVLRPYIDPTDQDARLGVVAEDGADSLVGYSYVDVQRQYEILYSYLAVLSGMSGVLADEMGGGPDGEILAELLGTIPLPSCRCVHRHVRPSISTLTSDAQGWTATTHQTVPSVNLTVAAPVAVGLLLPAVQAARAAARRMQSSNNLKQHALALLNYESAFKRFPAAYSTDKEGNPLLSWRVHVLPFVEQNDLYEQFRLDEPWDSDHNIQLLESMPEVFRSPQSIAPPGMTVYRANGGKNGVISKSTVEQMSQKFPQGNRIASITDGTSNTIAVIEVSDDLAVEWTKPVDFEPDPEEFWGLFGLHTGGTNAAFVDGSVHFLSEFVDEDLLKNLFNRHDGNVVNLWNAEAAGGRY